MWRPLLVISLSILLLSPAGAGAQQPAASTTISGGDLPYAVRLSASDEEAFRRRLAPPEALDVPQRPTGPSYTLTSSYWQHSLTYHDPATPAVDSAATYYPEGGFVRVRQAGEEVWLVLDLRQRAILGRYIRFARERRIGPEPGVFEVLRAAAETEPIAITVGTRDLTPDEARRFWEVSQPIQLRRDLMPPIPAGSWPQPSGDTDTWISFTLADGSFVEIFYSVVSAVLLDRFATDFYPVPRDWLVPVLGPAADFRSPDYALGASEIEQQSPRGSRWWWLVLVGAALSLGAAAWLRRPRVA